MTRKLVSSWYWRKRTFFIILGSLFGTCIWLSIFFPLLADDGYLLLLDWVQGPNHPILFGMKHRSLLLLLLLFVVGSIGIIKLFFFTQKNILKKFQSASTLYAYDFIIAALLAAWFYVTNPFVYQRIMVGHWKQILGYVVLPWIFLGLLHIIYEHKAKILAWLLPLTLFTIWQVPHYLFIITIPLLTTTAINIYDLKKQNPLQFMRKQWSWIFPIFLAIIIGSTLLFFSDTKNTVNQLGYQDFLIYPSLGDQRFGLWLNLFSLHGFWREGVEMMVIKEITVWPFAQMGLVLFMIIGLFSLRRFPRLLFLTLVCAITALILGAGPSSYTWKLTQWLVENIPLYAGMRESQKFLALLALIQAIWIFVGCIQVFEWLKRFHHLRSPFFLGLRVGIIATVSLCILINSWYLYGGTYGQIALVQYPQSWYETQRHLRELSNVKLTELPFSLYLRYPFHDRTTASAVNAFFDQEIPTLLSKNARTGSQLDINSETEILEHCYVEKDWACWSNQAVSQGITHILYQKKETNRIFELEFLYQQENIELILEDEFAALFILNP